MAASSQSKLLVYLIMLVGLILGFLYSSSVDPTAAVPVLDSRFELSSLKTLESARIDSSILKDAAYSTLRVFGSLPVKPESGGKSNPFQ